MSIGIQLATVASIIAILVKNGIISHLYPYGFSDYVPKDKRMVFGNIDYSNKSLMFQSGKLQKIYEKGKTTKDTLLRGHETIVFDAKDQMYVMTEHSKLIKVSNIQKKENEDFLLTAETKVLAHLGHGRPLGGAFDKQGNLYIADAVLGLLRVKFPSKVTKPVIELLASTVELKEDDEDEEGTLSPILFADDVTVGPKSGMVYFTDASHIPLDRIDEKTWDPMYGSKLFGFQGKSTGRLLRYDPTTGNVDVLISGLDFANGVSVNKEETMIFVAESFQARVLKYHLKGEKKGQVEVFIDKLPGIPDGVDCSHENGKCYIVIPSAKPGILKVLYAFPPAVDRILRGLAMALPKALAPSPKTYACIIEIDPNTNKTLKIFQDPYGEDLAHATGVTFNNGKLYIGSLHNKYIGVYDLS